MLVNLANRIIINTQYLRGVYAGKDRSLSNQTSLSSDDIDIIHPFIFGLTSKNELAVTRIEDIEVIRAIADAAICIVGSFGRGISLKLLLPPNFIHFVYSVVINTDLMASIVAYEDDGITSVDFNSSKINRILISTVDRTQEKEVYIGITDKESIKMIVKTITDSKYIYQK